MLLAKTTLTLTLIVILYIEDIKCVCGRRFVSHIQLIRSGFETNDGDWPWHSAIFHIGTNVDITYKCGGTLISSSSVLTGAHCVFEFSQPIVPERVLVELGKYNLLNSGINTQHFQVYSIYVHPGYDTVSLRNDIAIIRLSTLVAFNDFIQPICLWPSNFLDVREVVGKYGTLVGWGLTEHDRLSYILRQSSMPVVSQITCLESNRELFANFLSDTTFCAGSRNGTNACQGDSGGGLFFEDGHTFYIRGIASLAKYDKNMSCNFNDFVLFTDVAQYLNWIVELTPEVTTSPLRSGSSDQTTLDVWTLFTGKMQKRKNIVVSLSTITADVGLIPNPFSDNQDFSLQPDEVICSRHVSGGTLSINSKLQGAHRWSFLVGIYKFNADGLSFHCNGNLMSKRVVVTAAHCFRTREYQFSVDKYLLSLGQRNIFKERGLTVKILHVFIHPDYLSRGQSFDADVAVVIMQETVKYSDKIQPVCLWEGPYEKIKKDEVILVGWARETTTGVTEEPETDVNPFVSQETCLASNRIFESIISDRTCCTGRRDRHESCYFSGGAMLMETKTNNIRTLVLRGILVASLSEPDTNFCDSTQYVVSTDLEKFSMWIKYYILYANYYFNVTAPYKSYQ